MGPLLHQEMNSAIMSCLHKEFLFTSSSARIVPPTLVVFHIWHMIIPFEEIPSKQWLQTHYYDRSRDGISGTALWYWTVNMTLVVIGPRTDNPSTSLSKIIAD